MKRPLLTLDLSVSLPGSRRVRPSGAKEVGEMAPEIPAFKRSSIATWILDQYGAPNPSA